MKTLLLLLVLVLLPLSLIAQTATPDRDATPRTRLVPGCTLNVTVDEEAGLTGDYEIDAAGELHFTMDDGLGGHIEKWTVAVQGKTAQEARDAIITSLKTYLKMPVVSVVITRLPRLKIEVSGPVSKQGGLELALSSHLSDALNACACKPTADLANIRIIRKGKIDSAHPNAPAKPHIFAVNYEAFLRGESDDDPALETGDTILIAARPEIVAPKETQYVRVLGEVNREAAVPVADKMTVKDALERAGGLLATADRDKVRLIRGADGKCYELNANEIYGDNPVHNLPLVPGDLIIVGRRDQSLIYSIGGEVKSPQTLIWKAGDKVTLLAALAQAGGATKNADTHKGLLRKGFLRDPNQARVIVFDLDQIARKKQADWEIDAGDDIFLPPKQHRPSFLQQIAPLLLHFLPFGF